MPPSQNAALTKGKAKKQRRQVALQQERAAAALIAERLLKLQEVSEQSDLLEDYAPFRSFERNDLRATLETTKGADLSEEDVRVRAPTLSRRFDAPAAPTPAAHARALPSQFCVELQRESIAADASQPTDAFDADLARTAIRHKESRVLLLRGSGADDAAADQAGEGADEVADEWVMVASGEVEAATEAAAADRAPLGYMHLQFCLEEGTPMLVVLNLQLVPTARSKGLGKFAMQLVELIARRLGLELVMLSVRSGTVTTLRLSQHKAGLVAAAPRVAELPSPEDAFVIVNQPQPILPQGQAAVQVA